MHPISTTAALLAMTLHGCGTKPPSSPAEAPPIAAPPTAPVAEPSPEPTCDPDARDGTRCGDNDSRYCFKGRCLTQRDCVAACKTESDKSHAACVKQAREIACADGPCEEPYTELTRCAYDNRMGEASCATLRCGDDSLERELGGHAANTRASGTGKRVGPAAARGGLRG